MERVKFTRQVFFVVFIVWSLVLAGAFVHALSNFTAVQNAQSSVRAHPTELAMTFNETEGLITIKVRIENGGRLAVQVYEIPTQLLIRNMNASNQWLEVGQGNGRIDLAPGEVAFVTLTVKINLKNPSLTVQEALLHIQPGVDGAVRVWLVHGRVLFYVQPFEVRGEQPLCAGELVKCVI